MRLLTIIKVSLLIVILSMTFSACSEDNTATLNGTMTLQTRVVMEGAAEKFSCEPAPWIAVVIPTLANITFDEGPLGHLILFQDFLGEGAVGAAVTPAPAMTVNSQFDDPEPFKVTLVAGRPSSGFIAKGAVNGLADKFQDGTIPTHSVTLHLMIEIGEGNVVFELPLGGTGDTIELAEPTEPIPYIAYDGSMQELRIQSLSKDVSFLPGVGSISCSVNQDCATLVCQTPKKPLCVVEGTENNVCECVIFCTTETTEADCASLDCDTSQLECINLLCHCLEAI